MLLIETLSYLATASGMCHHCKDFSLLSLQLSSHCWSSLVNYNFMYRDSFKYRKYCAKQAILVHCACPGLFHVDNLHKTVPGTVFNPDSLMYYTGHQDDRKGGILLYLYVYIAWNNWSYYFIPLFLFQLLKPNTLHCATTRLSMRTDICTLTIMVKRTILMTSTRSSGGHIKNTYIFTSFPTKGHL